MGGHFIGIDFDCVEKPSKVRYKLWVKKTKKNAECPCEKNKPYATRQSSSRQSFGYAPNGLPGTAPHARDLSAALRFAFVPPHFAGGGHLCRPQYASRSLSGGVCSRSSSTPGGFTLRERSISSIHNSFPLQSARPQVREPGVRADIVANAVERASGDSVPAACRNRSCLLRDSGANRRA